MNNIIEKNRCTIFEFLQALEVLNPSHIYQMDIKEHSGIDMIMHSEIKTYNRDIHWFKRIRSNLSDTRKLAMSIHSLVFQHENLIWMLVQPTSEILMDPLSIRMKYNDPETIYKREEMTRINYKFKCLGYTKEYLDKKFERIENLIGESSKYGDTIISSAHNKRFRGPPLIKFKE